MGQFKKGSGSDRRKATLRRQNNLVLRTAIGFLASHSLCLAAVEVTNNSGDAAVIGSYPWAVEQVNAGGAGTDIIEFAATQDVDLDAAIVALTNPDLTLIESPATSTINGNTNESFKLGPPTSGTMTVEVNRVQYTGSSATIEGAAAVFNSGSGLDVDTIHLNSGRLVFESGATISGDFITDELPSFGDPSIQLVGPASATLTGSMTLNTDTWVQSAGSESLEDALVLAGEISGPGALKISDAGAVALQGVNTYSGGTTLLFGELILNTGAAQENPLGSGEVAQSSGTIFNVHGGSPYTLTNDWNLVADYYNPFVVWNVEDLQEVSLNGVVQQVEEGEAVTVIKQGLGTLALGGNNTFPGSVSVDEGVLKVNSNTALGSGSEGVVVSELGTLAFGDGLEIGVPIHFERSTPPTSDLPTLSIDAAATSKLTGAFVGDAFQKIGGGDLVVTNENKDYSSDVSVYDGALLITQNPEFTNPTFGTGTLHIERNAGDTANGAIGAVDINGTIANAIQIAQDANLSPTLLLKSEPVLVISGSIQSPDAGLWIQGEGIGDQVTLSPSSGANTLAFTKVEDAKLGVASAAALGDHALTLENGSFLYLSTPALDGVEVKVVNTGYFDPGGQNAVAPSFDDTSNGTLASDPNASPGTISFWETPPATLDVQFAESFPYFLDATGPAIEVAADQTLTFDSDSDSPTTLTKAVSGQGAVLVFADKPEYTLVIDADLETEGVFTFVNPTEQAAGAPSPKVEISTDNNFKPSAVELNNSNLVVKKGAIPNLDLTGSTIKSGSSGGVNNQITAEEDVVITYGPLAGSGGGSGGPLRVGGSGKHTFDQSNSDLDLPVVVTAGGTMELKSSSAIGSGQQGNNLKLALNSKVIFNSPQPDFHVPVVFDDDPLFQVDQPVEADGVITGVGPVIKTGLERLHVLGANTFTGGFQIQEGTLAVNSDSNLGAADGPVAFTGAGTTLEFMGNAQLNASRNVVVNAEATIDVGTQRVSILGAIEGSADLAKKGAGTLTLFGLSDTYTGAATVSAGTLSVRNRFGGAGSSVTVDEGAAIRGTGRVNSLALDGRLIADGTSVISVEENSTFANTAAYFAQVQPDGSSNHLVGGTASLEGLLNVHVGHSGGAFIFGDKLPLVTAQNVSGRFSTVEFEGDGIVSDQEVPTLVRARGQKDCCTYNACCGSGCCVDPLSPHSPGGQFALVYTPTEVFLEVLQGSFPAGRPDCCPAAGVYDYLISIPVGDDEDLREVYDALAKLQGCSFAEAVVQLSPADWGGMSQTAQELAMLSQTINAQRVGLLAHTPCADLRRGLRGWASAIGGGATQSGKGGYAGWSAQLLQVGIGTDYTVDRWRVGGSFTFGHDQTNWSSSQSSGRLNSYGGSLYASWTGSRAYAYGSAYGAGASYKGHREICFPGVHRTACNSHGGASLALRMGLGYEAKYDNVSLIPYLDGDLSAIRESSWLESGAGSLDLSVRSRTVSYGRVSVGGAVAGCRGDEESGLEAVAALGYTYQNALNHPCLSSNFGCDCNADCLALSDNNKAQNWANPSFSLKWHGLGGIELLIQGGANLGTSIKSGYGLAQLVFRF